MSRDWLCVARACECLYCMYMHGCGDCRRPEGGRGTRHLPYMLEHIQVRSSTYYVSQGAKAPSRTT